MADIEKAEHTLREIMMASTRFINTAQEAERHFVVADVNTMFFAGIRDYITIISSLLAKVYALYKTNNILPSKELDAYEQEVFKQYGFLKQNDVEFADAVAAAQHVQRIAWELNEALLKYMVAQKRARAPTVKQLLDKIIEISESFLSNYGATDDEEDTTGVDERKSSVERTHDDDDDDDDNNSNAYTKTVKYDLQLHALVSELQRQLFESPLRSLVERLVTISQALTRVIREGAVDNAPRYVHATWAEARRVAGVMQAAAFAHGGRRQQKNNKKKELRKVIPLSRYPLKSKEK